MRSIQHFILFIYRQLIYSPNSIFQRFFFHEENIFNHFQWFSPHQNFFAGISIPRHYCAASFRQTKINTIHTPQASAKICKFFCQIYTFFSRSQKKILTYKWIHRPKHHWICVQATSFFNSKQQHLIVNSQVGCVSNS